MASSIDVMAKDDSSFLGWAAFAVAAAALVFGFVAVLNVGGSASSETTVATTAPVTVTLTDFKFTPEMIMVPSGGGVLHVVNSGSQQHKLEIPELKLTTGDIAPGGSEDLSLEKVADGTYTIDCPLPGHAAAGMTASLMVGAMAHDASGATAGSSGSSSSGATDSTMSWQDMDAMMKAIAEKFPAATEGHGGDELAPKVLADGTKEFDLTAKIVKWEVSPGKLVDAWTYNGVVPAPAIHVRTGDKVRIVLKNELPESTVIHFHGIKVPNSMDGVDPYTQEPIKPGDSYTYEFTAQGPAVGIYHSHHDAQVQVPNGLFGAFLIDEMPVPKVLADQGYGTIQHHVNMVLNDAGTIGLSLNGKSFPATEPYTMKVGEVMEVNYFNEGLMSHPMHLHQPSGWVIAKDGVPLLVPEPGDTINVAPGERYTVLYKAEEPGTWAWHCHILNHAEGSDGMFGMVTALIVEA
jgi:FtsP/CotA-like multicopper oxidase with cupredoxin domain